MTGVEAAAISALVSGTLKVVGNKLAPSLIKEYSSIVGVKEDLQEFHGHIKEINFGLETTDNSIGSRQSFASLKKLKDIYYDVEDVVDEFQLKCEKYKSDGDGGIVTRYLCTVPKSFAFQCKATNKIKAIKKRFAAIVKQRTDYLAITKQLKHLPESIGDCQMISTIDLGHCEELTMLLDSIGRNKKLRFLRLSFTKIERLLSTITTLRNLECLDLQGCGELVDLPKGIGNMDKLQVLNLKDCKNLGGMPLGIGQLSRLQKLGLFFVGKGGKFAGISELANVSRIGEELTIRDIEHVIEPNDAHMACLKQKTNIQRLDLQWWMGYGAREANIELEQAVLDGLVTYLPPSLQHLHLDWSEQLLQSPGHYQGSSSSLSASHLKKLHVTRLGSRHGWELLQHMTALESLEIICFFGVQTEFPESLWSLTSLWSLEVNQWSNIRMLSESIGDLRPLQKLTIQYCDSLSLPQSMGQLTSLQLLEIRWCNALHQLPDCLGELCSLRKLEIKDLP